MTTQLNIATVLAYSIEELQAMTAGQLSELHSIVKDSKQKAATLRTDLIAGLIRGKQKEKAAPDASEQLELVPVENSVKPKRKAPAKKKAAEPVAEEAAPEEVTPEPTKAPAKTKAPKAPAKTKAPAAEKAPEPVQEEKAPEPKKTLKRKKAAAPDLTKMTQAELLAHVASLQEKAEDFPAVINPEGKVSYERLDGFDTVQDIQRFIVENPLSLYMFVDEKLDDELTQFVVLYANANVIVLHDRNRQIDSTMTAQMKNMDAEKIKFDKINFKYSFYKRVAKK